jgi:choline kinase
MRGSLISTAVVLAAGLGVRLGPLGRLIPKGFIRLGDAPIICESLASLLEVGVRRVVVVTGHLADHYDRLPEPLGRHVEVVHNPDYSRSGSMYSLYCARERVEGDFVLLESDIIYERRALEAVVHSPHADLVVVSGPTGAGDEVFVETKGERLVNMSKDRDVLGPAVIGEFVGMSRISRRLFGRMLDWAAARWPVTLQVSYETDCLATLAGDHPIYCRLVENLIWAEIDDAKQLARARDEVYPAIQSRRGRTASLPPASNHPSPS